MSDEPSFQQLTDQEKDEVRAMLRAWRSGKTIVIALCWVGAAAGGLAIALNNGWMFIHQFFSGKN